MIQKKIRTTTINFENIIAITLGDLEGIGPEIVKKSLSGYEPRAAFVILGQVDYYKDDSISLISNLDEIKERGIYFYNIDDIQIAEADFPDPSYVFVRTGIRFALEKKVKALVTAPISKERWMRAGITYKGHTELLAETANVRNHSMFFWSDDMKVALFTVHIPLIDVFQHLEKARIVSFIQFLDGELNRLFGRRFRFLISGLNPHAGEEGIMGTEETDIIIPAIEALREESGIHIEGPFPPDTIFLKAREEKDSVVVSWYHDQGLIAFKLLNIHSGVNMTLGLPYIRTSPDHGTAFEIAGKGIANPSSMLQAITLAEDLVMPV
jgi:4-phospho-D-threonate 3-dehydrogenase / 4-phospho-D-erythronate 3-dehydrogenase